MGPMMAYDGPTHVIETSSLTSDFFFFEYAKLTFLLSENNFNVYLVILSDFDNFILGKILCYFDKLLDVLYNVNYI